MRLILSRKGVDAAAGGFPSPILPDGTMVSIPIPVREEATKVRDLRGRGTDLPELVEQLSGGRMVGDTPVHLDPDIDHGMVEERCPGWRGAFGQAGSAQRHLEQSGVGPGDLFLFFGWYREVERVEGRWRFRRGARNLHVIYGWLFVGHVEPLAGRYEEVLAAHPWLYAHPHVRRGGKGKGNDTLYIAADRVPDSLGEGPGSGIFPRLRPPLVLTAPEARARSLWSLPAAFHPSRSGAILSYHKDPGAWRLEGDHAFLRAAKRGQEFVIDIGGNSELLTWVRNLVALADGK